MKNKFIYWMPYFPIVGLLGLLLLKDWQLETCLDDADHFIFSAVFQGGCIINTIIYAA